MPRSDTRCSRFLGLPQNHLQAQLNRLSRAARISGKTEQRVDNSNHRVAATSNCSTCHRCHAKLFRHKCQQISQLFLRRRTRAICQDGVPRTWPLSADELDVPRIPTRLQLVLKTRLRVVFVLFRNQELTKRRPVAAFEIPRHFVDRDSDSILTRGKAGVTARFESVAAVALDGA